MTLTAVVTNCNYAHYLPKCIESALPYCDEILVYDDGSTDDSLEVLARYPVTVTHRDDASGSPIWGSNQGILDASCDHLLFLDADNYLIGQPPIGDVDYTFAPIDIVNDNERIVTRWEYDNRPLDSEGCFDYFITSCERGKPEMPFPWGGVWRTAFVKSLKWRPWPSTHFAADFRTALDWCLEAPTLAYSQQPFLAFRTHEGQWSASPERALMVADAVEYARSL
jgi:glycosyltransferase involved in cell wall biosynthesis